MIKVNVQVPTDSEFWGADATPAEAQAAAEKLVEMLREELAGWWEDAEITVEVSSTGDAQVSVTGDNGQMEANETAIHEYIWDNWRTALDSVA
jgi:ATP-dependent protease HslVU (ClpYQ) ATPase subunit